MLQPFQANTVSENRIVIIDVLHAYQPRQQVYYPGQIIHHYVPGGMVIPYELPQVFRMTIYGKLIEITVTDPLCVLAQLEYINNGVLLPTTELDATLHDYVFNEMTKRPSSQLPCIDGLTITLV
jgi:hypothetical protein